ncbi:hypothetical protein J6590_056524 [Homalodisca vitripennis]|nr:hypothetical protein J6590_056524 [Homalodisca vitripennis]
MDLTKLFEEQDKEKEETICKLLNEVKFLTQFKTNRTSQDREPKTLKDMETQTSNTETPDISPKSLIFVELVHIKRRQDQAEEFMKTIQAQLQYTTSYPNCPSNSISQNCSANDDKVSDGQINCKIYNHSDFQSLTADRDSNTTPGISQTCRQKLNTSVTNTVTKIIRPSTPGTSQTCRKKLNTSVTKDTKTEYFCDKKHDRKQQNINPRNQPNLNKTNYFSISLQAAKYAAGNNTSLTKSNLTPLTLEKKPPMTAIIRPDNESIEEFFMKNIDFFKRINKNFLNKPITLHRTHDMASATSQATSVTPHTELDQHHITAETEIHRSNPFLDHVSSINHHP